MDLESFTNNLSSILINRKIKTQAIFKLFEQVGVISKETTLIKDYIDKILDRYSSHENDYNTSLGELRIFFDDLMFQMESLQITDVKNTEYASHLLLICKDWVDNGSNTNIASTFFEYASPIFEKSKSGRTTPLKRLAIDICLKIKVAYNNLEKIESNIHERIKESALLHNRAFEAGDKIIKQL